jgi:hypothetical protein
MAAAGHEVWILDSCNSNTNPALFRYEHGSPQNIEEVSLPPASGPGEAGQRVACGLAASGESVWAGLTAPKSIAHATVDPALNIAKADAPRTPAGTADRYWPRRGAVWVANYADNVV